MNINVNIHFPNEDKILESLLLIIKNQKKMDNTLDDVLQEVADEGTQIDSLTVLMDGVEQQLKDALAGATIPPVVQAKIDTVFTNIATNKQKVVDAINKNTPPPPPPPPPPAG